MAKSSSYDEDIVNQLETFGYAKSTECINASYKCVEYKNPNEVIQRIIDDEQSNSIHVYEHDCISITSNINNSIKLSPSPPPGPPPSLYRNKRHMLQFPRWQDHSSPR
eukprot:40460_1